MTARTHLVALFLAGLLARTALAVDVTTCGQYVPSGEVAILSADLDCSATDRDAVYLDDGVTLELNGHTIVGSATALVSVVLCADGENYERHVRCTVIGPGQLTGADSGIGTLAGGRITASGGIDIHDTRAGGIGAVNAFRHTGASVIATDVTVHDCGTGILADGKIVATRVTVNDNAGDGLAASKKLVARSVTADRNGGGGISAGRSVDVDGLEATGNGVVGVQTGRGGGRIFNAVVTQNGVDVRTSRLPHVSNLTCEHSVSLTTGAPWGFCSLD